MPEELWVAAVALAREHGLCAAAHGLGVSYNSLQQRVQGTRAKRRESKGSAATFVELGPPLPFGGGGPTLELTDSDGAKLAVRLAASEIIDITGLAREFWSRRR
jgi:hypothetical protein